MGSFLSTSHGMTLPPPVQTRGIISSACITPLDTPLTLIPDELLQRYSHRLANGPRGISKEQRHWFDVVFNAFCSQLESKKC